MKKLLIILIFLQSIVLYSQNPDYKVFIDSATGKMYYNRNQPVYFWIASKPDTGGQVLLLKIVSPTDQEPYYFDTEGINTFRVKDVKNPFGYKEAVFDIWADGIGPIVGYRFKGLTAYKKGKVIIGPSTKIELFAKDGISGLQEIYYAINSNEFKIYRYPFSLKKAGENLIKFYAIDKVGNPSMPKEIKVYLDESPPVVEIYAYPTLSDSVLSQFSYFKFKVSDSLTGVKRVYYKIDDSPNFLPFSRLVSVRNLSSGKHVIYYYAVDEVGNQSPVYMHHFWVDKESPEVNYRILGDYLKKQNLIIVSPNSKIELYAIDNTKLPCKIKYSLGKGYVDYQTVINLSSLRGYKELLFYAEDIAKNKSMVKRLSIYVDWRAPKVSYSIEGPSFFDRDTLFITSSSKITFSATDDVAGVASIEYAINNYNFQPYISAINLHSEGYYVIYYRAIDKVGNISKVDSFQVYVDNTPPRVDIVFSIMPIHTKEVDGEQVEVYPDYLKIYLGAKDAKTGEEKIYYSLNGSPFRLYINPIVFTKSSKLYTLVVKSKDKLGNEIEKQVKFYVESQ